MNEYYFKVENLTVGYGEQPVVSHIDIRLNRGKILTLIGPNGSGKTTVLRSIAGQLKKMSGTVFLDGRDMDEIGRRELSREMSVMLTERIRPELMTCRDIAAAGRYPYTGRLGFLSEKDRRAADEALEMVEMSEYADVDFRNISDGQQQRVMLARAICQEPQLLILDEPSSYLDIRHKTGVLRILRRLVREKGVTVIMSLHELELAQRVSDLVLCIRDCRADRLGTPEEIFREDYIRQLYGMEDGYFSEIFGSVELGRKKKTAGRNSDVRDSDSAENGFRNFRDGEASSCHPEVFVIAGGGSGARVFRRLQRENISFAAGVLPKNDIDYELARMLADRVIEEQPFCRVSQAAFEEALAVMKTCRRVICCLEENEFGEMNEKNRLLLKEAEKEGIPAEFIGRS